MDDKRRHPINVRAGMIAIDCVGVRSSLHRALHTPEVSLAAVRSAASLFSVMDVSSFLVSSCMFARLVVSTSDRVVALQMGTGAEVSERDRERESKEGKAREGEECRRHEAIV